MICCKNVWWICEGGKVVFIDGPEDPPVHGEGPPLHNFRSSSLKKVLSNSRLSKCNICTQIKTKMVETKDQNARMELRRTREQHLLKQSGQDDEVKNHVIKELSCEKPKIKLVFCTSVVGMGFNSPSIERVIHARPPRSLSDYIQEIGRAGRTGKDSTALLHYCNRDVAANVKDIKDDIIGFCKEKGCLREYILKQYGFQKSEIDLHQCCNNCRPHCLCIECQMLRIDI
ncbi:recQ [Mytilus edulis]|uniref:DNA 3'-5' helicase n=1 Tax=Mytilus edulis TaxID=6550 RepID=A0A8S3QX01_MYTED|nr:recQ [Mytilus edulis]